jgi:hypothetical protein
METFLISFWLACRGWGGGNKALQAQNNDLNWLIMIVIKFDLQIITFKLKWTPWYLICRLKWSKLWEVKALFSVGLWPPLPISDQWDAIKTQYLASLFFALPWDSQAQHAWEVADTNRERQEVNWSEVEMNEGSGFGVLGGHRVRGGKSAVPAKKEARPPSPRHPWICTQ